MITALVFDLDDTLYVERDFVTSGYREVARYISRKGGAPEGHAFQEMVSTFMTHGRDVVLTAVMKRFPDTAVSVAELVDVYRRHSPSIQLPPGYWELLMSLRRDYRLGIITDGHPEVQRRKVKALGLQDAMDHIIYTWDYGRSMEKPHALGFQLMLKSLCADPSNVLFIGDNPVKDCAGAHGVGMRFVQVAGADEKAVNPEVPVSSGQAEFFINNLHELPGILQLTR